MFTCHPSLPQLGLIMKQNYATLRNSDTCKEAFGQQPILSHRRPKNVRDYLVRAKLKTASTDKPEGVTKCNSTRDCITSKHTSNGTINTDKNTRIRQRLDYNTTNVIYMLQCKRCLQNGTKNCQYIEQTGRRLRDRLNKHRRDIIIKRHGKSGVAEHFRQPVHTLHDYKLRLYY